MTTAPHLIQPRLSFAALLDYICANYRADDEDVWNETTARPEPTNRRISRITGRPMSMIQSWRSQDAIPLMTADKIAAHMGLHPMSIWPGEYDRIEIHPWGLLDTKARTAAIQYLRARGLKAGVEGFDEALEAECWRRLDAELVAV